MWSSLFWSETENVLNANEILKRAKHGEVKNSSKHSEPYSHCSDRMLHFSASKLPAALFNDATFRGVGELLFTVTDRPQWHWKPLLKRPWGYQFLIFFSCTQVVDKNTFTSQLLSEFIQLILPSQRLSVNYWWATLSSGTFCQFGPKVCVVIFTPFTLKQMQGLLRQWRTCRPPVLLVLIWEYNVSATHSHFPGDLIDGMCVCSSRCWHSCGSHWKERSSSGDSEPATFHDIT